MRLIVGFAAGGAPDIVARVLGQWLSERLAQPFIIENRTGAGGSIATEAVAHAPPDGHALLFVTSANTINMTLDGGLNFMRDIVPVASISREPIVMAVNPSFPASTVPAFIGHAKSSPGRLSMGSPGTGTSPHMAGELFKFMTGTDLVHVPYRGSPPALTDLIGGRLQVMFSPLPPSIEYIRTGKLRALAVTTAARSGALPDIPTVGDFVPGYEASAFYGIGAPDQHARRDRRPAQPGDQCGPGRSRAEGAACRPRLLGPDRLACGLRQARCRGNREVGQGREALRSQARLIRGPRAHFTRVRRQVSRCRRRLRNGSENAAAGGIAKRRITNIDDRPSSFFAAGKRIERRSQN